MIKTHDLIKRFGKTTAVNKISLSVSAGEIFGIVGPDGAGKSTLMKLCATTLESDGGSIIIHGIDVSRNIFSAREHCAYMPQRFGLYEDLTVEENIYFFGSLYGVSKSIIKERLPRLYSFSRLEPFRTRLAGKLSGGMKQKLGLICSLIHTPKILILDEPTNGVDPVSRREFWGILYELLSDGVSILVSTAYLDEAERCSKIALMNEGRFMMSGTPQQIKDAAGNSFCIATCEETEKTEQLLAKIITNARISRTGDTLRFFLNHQSQTDIENKIKKSGIRSCSIKKAIPSLEDCFLKFMGRKQAK